MSATSRTGLHSLTRLTCCAHCLRAASAPRAGIAKSKSVVCAVRATTVKGAVTAMAELTHTDLVRRAVVMARSSGYSVIFAEMATQESVYIPDVLAWQPGGRRSLLVECKASRSDFLADRKKPIHAAPEMFPGESRVYLVAEGVAKAEDVPPNWGLTVVRSKTSRLVIERLPTPLAPSVKRLQSEIHYLTKALRRLDLGAEFNPVSGKFVPQGQSGATGHELDRATHGGRCSKCGAKIYEWQPSGSRLEGCVLLSTECKPRRGR